MNATDMKILEYCERHGGITAKQAVLSLGISDANKTIANMTKRGYTVTVEKRVNDAGKPYNFYRITAGSASKQIYIGQKVMFDPFRNINNSSERLHAEIVGTVVSINEPHGWFSVQHSNNQRISFFFWEVGKIVHIC